MSARSIAASASAARWSGPDKPHGAVAGRARRLRSTTSARIREIWEVILTGGDPLVLSPRRLACGDDEPCRDRSRQDRPHSYADAGRRARASDDADWCERIKVKGKPTYVAVHVNHPRELTHAGARGMCAAGRCRHSDAVTNGAARRRQRHAGHDGRIDARLGRVPDQALLSASRRSRTRHRPPAHRHRATDKS